MADEQTGEEIENNPTSTSLPLSDTEESYISLHQETEDASSDHISLHDEPDWDRAKSEYQRDISDIEVDTEVDTAVDTGIDTMTSRWLTSARSDQQAEGMAVAVKREDRTNLSADALLKLQRASTEGMTHKFSLMSHTTDDQLVECYNLSLRIEELKHSLKKADTIGGFDVFERNIIQPETPMPHEIPLIEKIDDITQYQVRSSIRFRRYYGQTFDIQDLQWSQELLENSCDEDLRIKVLERLRPIPDVEQGGPLFYYMMIQLIQTDAEQAVRTLIDKLEHLSLKTLSGENIFTACSLIRGVLDRLKAVKQVPHDVQSTILEILQTSSVDDFNGVFKTLSDSKFLGISIAKMTDEILILAERLYTKLLSKNVWTGVGRVGKSTFLADGSPDTDVADLAKQMAEQTCWNCNQKGHMANACPQPKKGRNNRDGNRKGGTGGLRIPP
jgi:hypothetical protein